MVGMYFIIALKSLSHCCGQGESRLHLLNKKGKPLCVLYTQSTLMVSELVINQAIDYCPILAFDTCTIATSTYEYAK